MTPIPASEGKETIVVYHGPVCFDGFCAAWVLHRAFPEATFVPATYNGKTLDDVTDKNVIIADFSYPLEEMKRIVETARRVVVLDHHLTAQNTITKLIEELKSEDKHHNWEFVFDMLRSGGRITWDWVQANGYIPAQEMPWLVAYTEDRDLWRHELPHSKEINAALRNYKPSYELWDNFEHLGADEFIPEGETVLRYEKNVVAEHTRHPREITLGGYQIKACNATVLFSEIAGELAKDAPLGACYFDRADGRRQWSLRSIEGAEGSVDVSALAKKFNGGGHKHAAGFESAQTFLGDE